MSRILHVSLKLVLVGLMASYPHIAAGGTATAASAAGARQSIFAKTGTLKGVLLYQESGKPVSETALTVLDAQGKKVAEAVTDKQGKFSLPNLQPGNYRLMIGEGVELRLNVADKGTASDLRILLPADGEALGAGLIEGPAEGATRWTYIAIAGVVAAVLVPVGFAVGHSGGDDDDAHD